MSSPENLPVQCKRKRSPNLEQAEKRQKVSTGINDLPNEIMLKIFSTVPKRDIHSNVKVVCKKWNILAKDWSVWKQITLDKSVPLKIARNWLAASPRVHHLIIKDRTDCNVIMQDVSKHCKHLESLRVSNCRGSLVSRIIRSGPLCNLLKKCADLHIIEFDRAVFNSCKFFELLSCRKRKSCLYKCLLSANQLAAIWRLSNQMEYSTYLRNANNRIYKLDDVIDMISKNYDSGNGSNIMEDVIRFIHDPNNS